MENSKQWYSSKALWVNVIAIVAILAQKYTGYVLEPATQVLILGVVNGILRMITGKPVEFGKTSFFRK